MDMDKDRVNVGVVIGNVVEQVGRSAWLPPGSWQHKNQRPEDQALAVMLIVGKRPRLAPE